MVDGDPRSEYPLGTRRPDLVRTPSGLALSELTLDALRAGSISSDDVRATPETLRRQGAIARAAGRTQLAENLERAAELAGVPDEAILEIYTALRPGRSTAGRAGGVGAAARSRARGTTGRGLRPRGI